MAMAKRRDELRLLDQRIAMLKQRRAVVVGNEKAAARSRDTRRKVIFGAKLMARRDSDPRARALIDEMNGELTETEKEAFVDWTP